MVAMTKQVLCIISVNKLRVLWYKMCLSKITASDYSFGIFKIVYVYLKYKLKIIKKYISL